MGTFNFRIILQTPLKLPRERVYRDESGHIYIPGASLKGSIRKSLASLADAGKTQPGLADKLLGTLSDDVAKAAAFSVSSALTEDPVETAFKPRVQLELETGAAKAGSLHKEEVVPEGTVFNGTIHSQLPENTAEDMALRLAMFSIRNVGAGTTQGWGDCRVEITDEATRTELLYDIDAPQKTPLKIEAAKLWVPNLENELLSHFAKKPEEMRQMPARAFEELVAALFRREGFIVELTPESWDGGYDILAIRHNKYTGNETFLVECKRYAERRRVGIDVIRNLMGVIQFENATKGIITTTTSFSSEARRRAETVSTRLVLHDYDFLKHWLHDVSLRCA